MIANLQQEMRGVDDDNDGIADPIAEERLSLDKDKAKEDQMVKMKSLDQDMVKHRDKMKREDAKIAVSRAKPTGTK